jgi:hypothetical protein
MILLGGKDVGHEGKTLSLVLSRNLVGKCKRRQNHFAALTSPFERTRLNPCLNGKPLFRPLEQFALAVPRDHPSRHGNCNRAATTRTTASNDFSHGRIMAA